MENKIIDIAGWKAGDPWHDTANLLMKLLSAITCSISNKPVILGELVKKCFHVLCLLHEIAKLQNEMEGNISGNDL